MELHINDNQRLEDIRESFSSRFPFLKIEFFRSAHSEGAGSPKSEMITEDVTVGEIRKTAKEGELRIHAEMKVSELEGQFEDQFGIHAQVFRKSGNLWLETSATDQWSLGDQNDTGKEMS